MKGNKNLIKLKSKKDSFKKYKTNKPVGGI